MSKRKVIVNAQEVALYSRDKKKKTIKKDEIAKIICKRHLMDDFAPDINYICFVYSTSKVIIRFDMPNNIIQDFERLTSYKII
ncbi:MAG: hypothetical protein J1F36_01840 [Clostridiales bacterium]|nr:hypothetical protein [Clostridiales bacterium]